MLGETRLAHVTVRVFASVKFALMRQKSDFASILSLEVAQLFTCNLEVSRTEKFHHRRVKGLSSAGPLDLNLAIDVVIKENLL